MDQSEAEHPMPLPETSAMDDVVVDVHRLQTYASFGDDDRSRVQPLHDLLGDHATELADLLLAHLQVFRHFDAFFADPAKRDQLAAAVRRYFSRFGYRDEPADLVPLVAFGRWCEDAAIEPKWLIAAAAKVADLVGDVLMRSDAHGGRMPGRLLATLWKLITIDQAIIMEAYHVASLQRHEATIEELGEAQQQLLASSRLDELTQVSNRGYLMQALEVELFRCRRFGRPFALIVIDVDHFKVVNDTHGHLYGDYVLKRLATIVREVVRPADIVGRYGGEEFLVGLIEADLASAKIVGERIRRTVAATTFEDDGVRTRMTISLGIAVLSARCDDLKSILKQADAALYRAKEAGRNCVRVGIYDSDE